MSSPPKRVSLLKGLQNVIEIEWQKWFSTLPTLRDDNTFTGTNYFTTIGSNSADTATVFEDNAGREMGQLCKAWVNFDGTGTVAIRDSFNVSSITDNGTGNYTVNFTSAFADANYSVASIGGVNDTTGSNRTDYTTGSIRVRNRDTSAGVLSDSDNINVSVFSN